MSALSDNETPRRVKSIRFGNSSKFIAIDTLPEELRGVFEFFDSDGDGVITTTELADAAHAHRILKAQNSLFRKGLVFTSGLAVAMVAAVGGMTYGIINASKDTVVEGRSLLTKSADPVSINVNEELIALGSLAYMPKDVPSKVSEITVEGEEGEIYYRTMKSINIFPNESFLLTTLDGDTVSWDYNEADNIQITLADGKTWSSSATCATCSATSIVANQAVLDALQDFHQVADETHVGRELANRTKSCRWGSDKRLKRDIHFVGRSPSGIPTYTFQYREDMEDVLHGSVDTNVVYFGAMAQDLLEMAPGAVVMDPTGYYSVDYSNIDVNFHKRV